MTACAEEIFRKHLEKSYNEPSNGVTLSLGDDIVALLKVGNDEI